MNTSEPASEHAGQGASIPTANAPQPRGGSVASGLHTFGLLAFLAIWAYYGRVRAGHMRAHLSPNHFHLYAEMLATEWLVFAYVVFGVRRYGVSLRELVGPRWTRASQAFKDVAIAAAFEVAALIVIGAARFSLHADSNIQTLQFMMPVGVSEMAMWVLLSVTAGVCEETIFRGYLQRQFMAWTGNAAAGVAISAAMFGACHIYQGGKQTIVLAIYGAMFGTLAVLRRSLKPGILAHAFQDTSAGMVLSLAIKYKLGGM
jgi:hypothetical protein